MPKELCQPPHLGKAKLQEPLRREIPSRVLRNLLAARRPEITAAFKTAMPGRHRKRLRAVEAFLSGQPLSTAARFAGMQPEGFKLYLRRIQQRGVRPVTLRRKRRSDNSLPITDAALAHALAQEQPPAKRKRLIALRAVLRGDTNRDAAEAAETTCDSVARWIKLARKEGMAGILTEHPRPGRPRVHPLTPELIASARAQIAAATNPRSRSRLQCRLRALDAALAGAALKSAAALGNIQTNTLKTWLAQIRNHGIACLLAKWGANDQSPQPKLGADAASLRAHAASEQDPLIRKRFLALAYLAEGFSADDAAVRAGLSTATLRQNIRRFREGGVAALRNKAYPGSGPKLRPKELQAVAKLASAMAPEQLRAHIEAEFGVRYSLGGLKNMLKKQIGIAYDRSGPQAM